MKVQSISLARFVYLCLSITGAVVLIFSMAPLAIQSSNPVSHPTPDNIPDVSVIPITVDSTPTDISPRIEQLSARLRNATLVRSLGSPSGSGDSLFFGLIEDLAAGPNRFVFVLDSRLNRVLSIASDGSLISEYGRAGRGPEEFMYPTALAVGQKFVYVVDRARSLKVLSLTEEGNLVHLTTHRLRQTPRDLCVLDSKAVVHGWDLNGSRIHEYGQDGVLLRSLIPTYHAQHPAISEQLSIGPMACSRRQDMIVLAGGQLPFLWAYHIDGTLQWVARIEDFRQAAISSLVSDEQFRLTTGLDGPSRDYIVNLTEHDGTLLAQVARSDTLSLRARKPHANIHSYLLDLATGLGVYIGTSLPEVRAIMGDTILAVQNSPFPQLLELSF